VPSGDKEMSRRTQSMCQHIEGNKTINNICRDNKTYQRTFNTLVLLQDEATEESQSQDITVGDKVTILNNYKGLQGAKGTVIVRVTKKQASIRLTNGLIVQGARNNLVKH
jgi:hypothetical protein